MTETAPQLQPLYLLADSQLLFWKRQDRLLLEAALDGLARDTSLSAAYIGASNGDRPEFYGIFEAAVRRSMIELLDVFKRVPAPPEGIPSPVAAPSSK